MLNLLVLRARDPRGLAEFYGLLGLRFVPEKHGNGPDHMACDSGGSVVEIYPRKSGQESTRSVRLGFAMLQRTTATAVSRFYGEFFARFDSWTSLAAVQPGDLEQFLKPLGLWRRRAASLLGLASYAAKTGGAFPSDPELHREIPAVGQYVSNAVLMFQHGRRTPLLDVNMARVIERFVRPRRLADIRYDPWLQAAAHWFVRGDRPELALDFAALVCKARRPLCPACPVNDRCRFYAETGGPADMRALA